MASPLVTVRPQTVLLNSPIAVTELFDATAVGAPITSFTFFDSRSSNATGFFTLNGSAIPNGTPFTVTPEELSSVFYVASSEIGFEQFGVLARNSVGEFSQFGNLARIYSVQPNTTVPFVTAPNFDALSDEAIPGAEFIAGFDPDGFPISEFELTDTVPVNFLQSVNGLVFVGSFQHNFSDGELVTIQDSSDSGFNITGIADVRNENLFSIVAPNVAPGFGDTSGVTTFTNDGGAFELNGVEQPRGVPFSFSADQIDDVTYRAEGPDDVKTIRLRGFDGTDFSFNTRGLINISANENAPVVQFTSSETPAAAEHSFTEFLDVVDADGNSVDFFRFANNNLDPALGDLIFQGQTIPRFTSFDVPASQLDQLVFRAENNTPGEQLISVQAFDGSFFSNTNQHAITTLPPAITPEITRDEGIIVSEHLSPIGLGDIFSVADAGNEHISVQVFDPTTNAESGSLRFFNTPIAGGVVQEFSVAEFEAGVEFFTGEFLQRQNEVVFQRNFNGDEFTRWEKIEVSSEPELFSTFNAIGQGPVSWLPLLSTNAVGRLEIPFSFMQEFPDYFTGEAIDGDPNLNQEFQPFDNQQRENVRLAFDTIERALNIEFVEVSDTSTNLLGGRGGIIRFGEYGLPSPPSNAQAFTFFPTTNPEGGDIWVNRLLATDPQLEFGGPGFTTLLHEIGHVLGQEHVFDGVTLPPATANDDFSVLSGGPGSGSLTGLSPTTFQVYDIFNLQSVYGARTDFNTGDNVYDASSFGGQTAFLETLWDAGGSDTLSAALNPIPSVIDLREGEQNTIGSSSNNLTIAFGTLIENGIGSAFNDTISGNFLDNELDGGTGDDVIEGGVGNDLLTGGVGDDRFIWGVGDENDIIDEQGLAGRDTIEIPAFPGVDNIAEDLEFRLNGRDLVIDLTIDGGTSEGTITITNQTFGGFRIESLEIGGQQRIDLVNLASQLESGQELQFGILPTSSDFGSLVTPI